MSCVTLEILLMIVLVRDGKRRFFQCVASSE